MLVEQLLRRPTQKLLRCVYRFVWFFFKNSKISVNKNNCNQNKKRETKHSSIFHRLWFFVTRACALGAKRRLYINSRAITQINSKIRVKFNFFSASIFSFTLCLCMCVYHCEQKNRTKEKPFHLIFFGWRKIYIHWSSRNHTHVSVVWKPKI